MSINKIKIGDIVLYDTPECPNVYGKVIKISKIVASELLSEPKGSLIFTLEDLFKVGITNPINVPQSCIKEFYRGTTINPTVIAGD